MSATARTRIYIGYDWDDDGARLMVENILNECGIHDYTLYSAVGHWDGQSEVSLIIEVIGDEPADDFAINEAAHILQHNMDRPQEEVWIVRELVDLVIVS